MDRLYGPGMERFCRENGISLAVLFGSRATGKAVEGSDIDLALWVERSELLAESLAAARARKKLLWKLIDYLQTGEVDLVLLNRASALLKFQVARNGKPLFQKTPSLFAAFCSRALREHNDAQVFYQGTKDYLQRATERRELRG